MLKHLTLMLCLLLTACAPSAGSVSTAIAQTEAAAAATAASQDCPVDAVLKAIDDLQATLQRWDDAFSIANATGRGNLSGPVSKLQDVRTEAQAFDVPVCLEFAKTDLVGGMNSSIDGFLAFMAQKPDATVNASFDTAQTYFNEFATDIVQVKACAPNCKPTPTPAP